MTTGLILYSLFGIVVESREDARLELTQSEKRQIEIVCFQPLDEAIQKLQKLRQYECWFGGKLIQKLRQKEVDEESCMKTCSMNWGEANSVYTSYIVSSASNGKIQAGALIFVLVGYI
ncbi:hypothetical protein Tco_0041846, partial [Tanacetum coccineum]